MTRMQIEDCNDIQTLKNIALEQHSALFKIGEALVDNDKNHLTDVKTIWEGLKSREITAS